MIMHVQYFYTHRNCIKMAIGSDGVHTLDGRLGHDKLCVAARNRAHKLAKVQAYTHFCLYRGTSYLHRTKVSDTMAIYPENNYKGRSK